MSSLQENKNEGQGHEKEFAIIVNGRSKTVTTRELSFDQIVALAFDTPPSGPDVLFTITYKKGDNSKPEGSMVAGEQVKIKDGMIFNVTATNKS
jgi:hypothetical protein